MSNTAKPLPVHTHEGSSTISPSPSQPFDPGRFRVPPSPDRSETATTAPRPEGAPPSGSPGRFDDWARSSAPVTRADRIADNWRRLSVATGLTVDELKELSLLEAAALMYAADKRGRDVVLAVAAPELAAGAPAVAAEFYVPCAARSCGAPLDTRDSHVANYTPEGGRAHLSCVIDLHTDGKAAR